VTLAIPRSASNLGLYDSTEAELVEALGDRARYWVEGKVWIQCGVARISINYGRSNQFLCGHTARALYSAA